MMTKRGLLVTALFYTFLLGTVISCNAYVFLSDYPQSLTHTFKTGTLTLSAHRSDVPIEGPMFYTIDSDAGQMETGLWAPRDSRTRAMLIKNTGTVDAQLKALIAIPQGTAEQQADALEFGHQALVTVAALVTSDGQTLDLSLIDEMNRKVDKAFKDFLEENSLRGTAQTGQKLIAAARNFWLTWTYRVEFNNRSVEVRVSNVYVGSLKDLYNNGIGCNAILPNLILSAGKTMHLAYNVTFLDDEGQTFVNNNIQGKVVNFKFKNTFEQVKNNNR
jgi:spore coat-associated protein N